MTDDVMRCARCARNTPTIDMWCNDEGEEFCESCFQKRHPEEWYSERKAEAIAEALSFGPGSVLQTDPVSKPSHYNWHPSGVECKDIAEAFNYYLGNAIKYIWRADYKGKPIEDLQKARNCIDLELQRRAKQ